jgi:2-methylisocitrate lyase-like PEP mutase family enzyme
MDGSGLTRGGSYPAAVTDAVTLSARWSRPELASPGTDRPSCSPHGEGEAVTTFRALHAPGQLLLLANAWDAGSARLIQAQGAPAIGTTSAGLAWSRGHPDGDHLPLPVLAGALAEIARVVSLPLTVDIEGGYSNDPRTVAEVVRTVLDAGGTGINLEDGSSPPDLLCRKIEAARTVAAQTGIDLFVNARCDVYLRRLVADEAAVAAALERARLYRSAGCDGLFVPGVRESAPIRELTGGIGELPLNVLWLPGLPALPELRALGVRRLSAGSAIAQRAYGVARRATRRFLESGDCDAAEPQIAHPEMNALFG